MGEVRSTLYILLGAVGLILLIACANVANLLLSRSTARTLEMGIRCAMGARRTRLLMQLLAESLVLAAAGGVAGVALAFAGVRALHAFQPANLPRLGEVGEPIS